MTVIYPESAPSLGNVKVKAVVTVADLAAPKLATEINAGTSVDMSCALMVDGWMPSTTQGKTTKKRRLCSSSDTEMLNPALCQLGTILYSVGDPQNPNTSITGLMVEGQKLHFVERLGKDADVAFAVSDKTITHYVQLGKPYQIRDTGQDNGEFHMGVEAFYLGSGPVDGVVAA